MNYLDLRSNQGHAIALHTTFIISETVRDSGLVPKDHQSEMAYIGCHRTVT